MEEVLFLRLFFQGVREEWLTTFEHIVFKRRSKHHLVSIKLASNPTSNLHLSNQQSAGTLMLRSMELKTNFNHITTWRRVNLK